MSAGRGMKGRCSLFSCQLNYYLLLYLKKCLEDTQSLTKVTVLLCTLHPNTGMLLRGQGIALYNVFMFDFNRTRSILKTIKTTLIPQNAAVLGNIKKYTKTSQEKYFNNYNSYHLLFTVCQALCLRLCHILSNLIIKTTLRYALLLSSQVRKLRLREVRSIIVNLSKQH